MKYRVNALGMAALVMLLGACSHVPLQAVENVDLVAEKVQLSGKERATLLNQAVKKRLDQDWHSAALLYGQILNGHPEHKQALLGLAVVYDKQAKQVESELTFKALNARYPQFIEGRNAYVGFLLKNRKADRVIALLEPLVRSGKSVSSTTYSQYGVAKDLLGLHLEADRIYRQGLENDSTSLTLRNNLAFCMLLQGRYHYAAIILEDVTRADESRDGGESPYRHNLSLAWALKGRVEKSRAAVAGVLKAAAVDSNQGYYDWLRTLSRPDRRQALLQLL